MILKSFIFTLFVFLFGMQTNAIAQEPKIIPPTVVTKNGKTYGKFNMDATINQAWIHYITEINQKESTITLNNGSKWKLGRFYAGVLKKWKMGDQVTLSWYENTMFLDTQIINMTNQDYAWSNIKSAPNPDAPGFLTILKMPNRMVIELSNGTRVTTEYAWMFREFHEGDVVMTLYGKGTGTKTRYSLWDLSSSLIAYDLVVS